MRRAAVSYRSRDVFTATITRSGSSDREGTRYIALCAPQFCFSNSRSLFHSPLPLPSSHPAVREKAGCLAGSGSSEGESTAAGDIVSGVEGCEGDATEAADLCLFNSKVKTNKRKRVLLLHCCCKKLPFLCLFVIVRGLIQKNAMYISYMHRFYSGGYASYKLVLALYLHHFPIFSWTCLCFLQW